MVQKISEFKKKRKIHDLSMYFLAIFLLILTPFGILIAVIDPLSRIVKHLFVKPEIFQKRIYEKGIEQFIEVSFGSWLSNQLIGLTLLIGGLLIVLGLIWMLYSFAFTKPTFELTIKELKVISKAIKIPDQIFSDDESNRKKLAVLTDNMDHFIENNDF